MFVSSAVLDGARISTSIDGKFRLESDQPPPFGEDTAPAPCDIFLSGVAACTAYFAQRYCRKWKLPHEGISVDLEPAFDARHVLTDIRNLLNVPDSFPKDHLAGLLRNASACLVKKALESPPTVPLEAREV